jgi:predicted GNAT superfamily acetyltransferase
MHNVTLANGVVIRELATHDERAEAVRLQEDTWGAGFTERVPAAILLVGQKIGGVTAGAFDEAAGKRRLLGFVFGLTGTRNGRLVHWSDMLAVRPEAQGRHIGTALKNYQRDRCRALGVEVMFWTFDPFVARNANLNLNRLGAVVDEFVPDMYGANTNSPMHGALGTDRFVVSWQMDPSVITPRADRALEASVPVVAGPPGRAPGPGESLPEAGEVTVLVPRDYLALLAADIGAAREWRASARRAFLFYLGRGYRVTAFTANPTGEPRYLLSRGT